MEGERARREQPTRVLVAPTAFKGTLGPAAVGRAMAEGVRRAWPEAEADLCPLSDGGTGLLDALDELEGGRFEELSVRGPLGRRTVARVLWTGPARVTIESAEAVGHHLVPAARRDPRVATTRGLGELLADVRERADRIALGLGGSATVDGGTGMARALGWGFEDADGGALPEGGAELARLARIRRPADRWAVPVRALCDVDNPLLGPTGAARVYGPQKGAGPADVEVLEAGLARLAERIERDLGIEVAARPGAGAAGGLGAGARAFLGAELVSGAAWMMERARLSERIVGADAVLTGEGRYDPQSGMGKLPGRVLEAAGRAGRPTILVCGAIDGPLPEGVMGFDGGGDVLGAEDLAELTAVACRRLWADGRL